MSSGEERLKQRNRLLVFYESPEFKEAEKKRIEEAKPSEHEYMDEYKERVYCPVEDRVRPTWLCLQQHGDRDPRMDMDRDEDE